MEDRPGATAVGGVGEDNASTPTTAKDKAPRIYTYHQRKNHPEQKKPPWIRTHRRRRHEDDQTLAIKSTGIT